MDYTVRVATAADRATVWKMLRYASHESSLESVQKQSCLARYASNWGRFGDLGCIAEKDTLHLGMAWLRLWSESEKGFGYINETIPELAIAILPDYRGKGIGTHLLMQVLEMTENRFPAVSLSVRADNPVVKLYERFGFVKVPESEIINRTGAMSYNMVREVQSSTR